jgi:hypothetical protein
VALTAPRGAAYRQHREVVSASSSHYPGELREAEADLLGRRLGGLRRRLAAVEARRDAAGTPAALRATLDEQGRALAAQLGSIEARHASGKLVGLALSGGGMRSATFSLGFLQSLARLGLLREVDVLSTVSGGSYIGGFLGALFDRTAPGGAEPSWDVEEQLCDPRSKVIHWLRDNGRYLSPAGASDGWAALAVILRNMAAVNFMVWSLVLTAFLFLNLVRGALISLVVRWDPLRDLLLSVPVPGPIWWSPSILLPAAIAPLLLFPLGLAYWLVVERKSDHSGWFVRRIALLTNCGILLGSAVLGAGWVNFGWPKGAGMTGLVVGIESLLGLLLWAVADAQGEPRHRLSRWLKAWLLVFVGLLVMALLDSAGQTAYVALLDPARGKAVVSWLVGGITSVLALATGGQKLVGFIGSADKNDRRKRGGIGIPLQAIALVAALLLLLPPLIGLSALGHGISWGWERPVSVAVAAWLRDPQVQWTWASVAALAGLGVCLGFGHAYSFLNSSSLAALYAARLTRAYLGASNGERLDGGTQQDRSSTDVLPGDRVDMATYSPESHGGPLHIINTTLNETVGGQSRVEERDRKGMNLAVGPGGVSVAARHHAVWVRADAAAGAPADGPVPPRTALRSVAQGSDGFHVFPGVVTARDAAGKATAVGERRFHPEMLDLGRWVAISGAAASTALGSLTSLGLSLLCGVLNVRLGHWWWSDVDPHDRQIQPRGAMLDLIGRAFSRVFPVQAHLIDELLARFPGTASRNWYLTDGGHFENTGVYELIRRELAVIIALDNGADPELAFEDVGNLVRKARVDFGAEIEFVAQVPVITTAPAGDGLVGDILGLGLAPAGEEQGKTTRYAALANVRYASGATGKLLLVKPGVVGRETLDILHYRAFNRDFPQQTTADQFFDEAQWESYRQLGHACGQALFGAGGQSGSPAGSLFSQLTG